MMWNTTILKHWNIWNNIFQLQYNNTMSKIQDTYTNHSNILCYWPSFAWARLRNHRRSDRYLRRRPTAGRVRSRRPRSWTRSMVVTGSCDMKRPLRWTWTGWWTVTQVVGSAWCVLSIIYKIHGCSFKKKIQKNQK